MTSPIGSSSVGHSSSLTSLNESRNNKNASTESTAGGSEPHEETVHPATPVGPLGHHINTTA